MRRVKFKFSYKPIKEGEEYPDEEGNEYIFRRRVCRFI
jgi:hypothetical protein